MVKIVNPLGDVKIGRQGEVVYQRKYGEQIRRTVSPKRAIPSQRQIAHRQLYRDALTWRKQLSLPNRRYLEGYCISNWIVDAYKIPLPWSRFTLKIYLEAIKFLPKLELEETPPIAGEKKDANNYPKVGMVWIGGTQWGMQSFTPLEGYPIGSVKINATQNGSPVPLIVGLRLTDGAGKPTGGDLATGSINAGLFPNFPNPNWQEIELTPPYDLQQGVKYAWVSRTPSSGGSFLGISQSGTASHYPRGNYAIGYSSGTSWTMQDWDALFEVWSALTAGEFTLAGTLHVRHPALLRVVQKRGGLTVREYDNLSSLDAEYLTGQVGLDVLAGDLIEATTLPGIKYSYQL